jgi:hypothetical protein
MICTKCRVDKAEAEFHKGKKVCKVCRSVKKFVSTKEDKNIKQSIYRALKNNTEIAWHKILGYNLEQLKEHLKLQFKDGMTFENYGKKWCISFFIPRRMFNITSINSKEFAKLYNIRNMKVITPEESHHQKAKIDMAEIMENNIMDLLPVGGFLTDKNNLSVKAQILFNKSLLMNKCIKYDNYVIDTEKISFDKYLNKVLNEVADSNDKQFRKNRVAEIEVFVKDKINEIVEVLF